MPLEIVLSLNIYIRPLSFVQNKLRFILHEPYDLSWPLSEWAEFWLKHVLLRFVDLRFFKEKQIHHVVKFSFLFGLTDS